MIANGSRQTAQDLAVTFENGKCTGIYAADKRTMHMVDITDEVRELLFPNLTATSDAAGGADRGGSKP